MRNFGAEPNSKRHSYGEQSAEPQIEISVVEIPGRRNQRNWQLNHLRKANGRKHGAAQPQENRDQDERAAGSR